MLIPIRTDSEMSSEYSILPCIKFNKVIAFDKSIP